MSDPFQIRAGERGVVRVFALDMPREQVEFLREPGALAQVLGVASLDMAQADILDLATLGEIGLSGYLVDGVGVAEDQVAPEAARLDALEGHALVLRSRAFDGAVTLNPGKGVRLAAILGEMPVDWRGGASIDTASAQPTPVPPRAARSRARRVGASVFAVVMLVLAAILLVLLT